MIIVLANGWPVSLRAVRESRRRITRCDSHPPPMEYGNKLHIGGATTNNRGNRITITGSRMTVPRGSVRDGPMQRSDSELPSPSLPLLPLLPSLPVASRCPCCPCCTCCPCCVDSTPSSALVHLGMCRQHWSTWVCGGRQQEWSCGGEGGSGTPGRSGKRY